MHKIRQASLAAVVLGGLIGQRLTVTDLGRSLQGQRSHKHNIKRVDRLFSNTHLHTEWPGIYRSLAHQLIAPQSRPVILIETMR